MTPPGAPPRLAPEPLYGVKRLPDAVWSVSPPAGDPRVAYWRLYQSPKKDVAAASRSLVTEQDYLTLGYTEAGAIPSPPGCTYLQVVLVGCDKAVEGPY